MVRRRALPVWFRFAPRRRLAAWAGLLALALNLALAGALPARAESALATAVLEGARVICTAGGMMVLDRDGVPVAMPDGAACVFCLPLLHGGAPPPAPTAAPPQPLAAAPDAAAVLPIIAGRRIQAPPPVRAPPLA